LDVPHEHIAFPCYAVFLDPGSALVLKCRAPSKSGNSILFTSNDAKRSRDQDPRFNDGQNWCFKSLADAVRIGVGTFVKNLGQETSDNEEAEKRGLRACNKNVDGPIGLDNLAFVSGDGSWGPVTENDPKVRVKVF
jgi:hypothetical protein